MIIFVRLFEGNSGVKEITIQTTKTTVTIKQIKQFLQAHLSLLGSKLFLTSPNMSTLYEEQDVLDNKEAKVTILAYSKTYQQPLSFRVASARARNPKVERISYFLE